MNSILLLITEDEKLKESKQKVEDFIKIETNCIFEAAVLQDKILRRFLRNVNSKEQKCIIDCSVSDANNCFLAFCFAFG